MAEDQSFTIRELEVGDYKKGFLECLKEMTVVGDISKEKFVETLEKRKDRGIITAVAVDIESDKILGTGSIFYEPKFIRGCSWKGYIEDVSVASYAQKRGVGKALVVFLKKRALKDGCYKVVLTCSDTNRGFYEKLDFERIEDGMAIYLERKQ